MIAAHTFVLTNIGGGVWPRLLETIAAAPVLTHLFLGDSPWFGKDRDIFDLPSTVGMPPLRSLSYIVPHAVAPSGGTFWATAKRPFHRLKREVKKHMCYLGGLPLQCGGSDSTRGTHTTLIELIAGLEFSPRALY
jgi:hypothetical protein